MKRKGRAPLAGGGAMVWSEEPRGLEDLFPRLGKRGSQAPKLWTDAYLAAFAIAGNHELVTYDKGLVIFKAAGLRLTLLKA